MIYDLIVHTVRIRSWGGKREMPNVERDGGSERGSERAARWGGEPERDLLRTVDLQGQRPPPRNHIRCFADIPQQRRCDSPISSGLALEFAQHGTASRYPRPLLSVLSRIGAAELSSPMNYCYSNTFEVDTVQSPFYSKRRKPTLYSRY